MKIATLSFAAALALLAGGCTTENYGHAPYYGPSQGYAYPSGYAYYPSRSYYAPAGYGYRTPYGAPYGGAGPGPSITFTFPQG
jgi:hypothetical protein